MADDYSYAPGQILLDTTEAPPGSPNTQSSRPHPGGGVTIFSTADGIFYCGVAWAPVQAQPSGYNIGNCKYGVHLHRQLRSDYYEGHYWDGGYVYGSFAGCGWIRTDYDFILSPTATPNCNPNSIGYRLNEYAFYTNDATTPKTSCSDNPSPTKCTDGTPVSLAYVCPAYWNYRPWVSGQPAIDRVKDANGADVWYPAGKVVRWRYISRYTSTSFPGQYMVMVRDPVLSPGSGNWMFIPSNCFTSYPGAQYVP